MNVVMCLACFFICIASLCGIAYELMDIFYDKLPSKILRIHSFISEICCISLTIGGIFLFIYGGYLIFK